MNLEERKRLRKSKILAREQLSIEDRASFSKIISERILASDIYHTAHTIMIYKSVKGEVCLEVLEKAALSEGKRLCYPLCISNFEVQKAEQVPMKAWDRRMDMIFTEKQVCIK